MSSSYTFNINDDYYYDNKITQKDMEVELTETTQNYTDIYVNERFLLPLDVVINSDWVYPAIIITAIGILGNFITMTKVLCDKTLHTPTYSIIGLLAFSDFLCLLLYVIQILIKDLHVGVDDEECKYTLTFYYITVHSSAGHVMLFWGIRLYLTANPLLARTNLTIKRVLISSGILWIISHVFGFLYYQVRFAPSVNVPVAVLSFRGYLLVVPCIVIFVLHKLKLKHLRRSPNSMRLTTEIQRMSRIVSLILGIYMSSAILYPLSFTLDYFTNFDDRKDIKFIIILARMCWLINASCNPIIYFLFAPPIYRVLVNFKMTVRQSIFGTDNQPNVYSIDMEGSRSIQEDSSI